MRPAVALVLVFAQAVASFGFPIVQSQKTVKACGCITPCGVASDNCCCSKPAPAPVKESKPGCAKCRDKTPAEPIATSSDDIATITWVAAFKVRQCRGESPMGLLAELPALPPVGESLDHETPLATGTLTIADSHFSSHFPIPLDPPPRRG